jgi:Domain of unknown function (DUF4136)/PDZ domain
MKKALLSFSVVLLLTSCCFAMGGGAPRASTLYPAELYLEPSITSSKEPDANFENYRTFSIFPFSALSKEAQIDTRSEKQTAFFVRNIIEKKGYKFVSRRSNPDLLIVVAVDSQYRETYIPPSTSTISIYVPGTYSNTDNTSPSPENINTNNSTIDQGEDYGSWGLNSPAISTNYVPGYVTSETVVNPGRVQGYYYPSAVIVVYDTKSKRSVLNIGGQGTSINPDIKVSSQLVLYKMLINFPLASNDHNGDAAMSTAEAKKDLVGIQDDSFTIDGSNYYPFITGLVDNMPAKNAGLELQDMIVAIDGKSTANKTPSELADMYWGQPGGEITMTIQRGNEIKEFHFKRTASS